MWKNIVHEEVFKSLLLEAKSPEEILRLIKYRYKDTVPEWFIEKVFSIDPTKKKSFTQWACNKYPRESSDFTTCLNDGTLKKVFDFFQKNSNTFSLADIESLEDAIGYAFTIHLDEYLQKNGDGEENDFDYDDVDNRWGVAQYHSYEASKKLGKDCIWCTANWYGNGEDYYDEYTSDGKLFVLIDKTSGEICNKKRYTFKRYQIFFDVEGNKDSEFRDSKNNSVLPEDVGFTRALYDHFIELGFDPHDEFLTVEEQIERYDEWRMDNIIGAITIGEDEYKIMPECETNLDIRDPEDCFYCIFSTDNYESEIDGSPYELKPFYDNAEIFVSRTFTVLESDGRVYVWYVEDEMLFTSYSSHIIYGSENSFNFYWTKGRLYFENETTSWLINSANVDPGSISAPKQKHDGGIYFNVTTNDGNTYLVKLLPGGKFNVEKFTNNSIFKLEGDEYVAEKQKVGESGLVGGKYIVLKDISDCGDGCRFFPCVNEFSDSIYNVNVYDEVKKKVVFPDDKCYEDYYCETGLIFLARQRGTDNSGEYVTDIFDMKSGEIVVSKCYVTDRVSWYGKYVARNSKNKVFFINTLGGSVEKFECNEIIEHDSIFWFVKTGNNSTNLINLKEWSFTTNVESFLIATYGIYFVKLNGGDTYLACYDIDNKLNTISLGKIDGNFYPIKTYSGRLFLVVCFKCAGDQKMSLYSPTFKKFILKDYITDIETNGPFHRSLFIGIYDGGDGFQIFNTSTLSFVGGGMRFKMSKNNHPVYVDGPVAIYFNLEFVSITPILIEINGKGVYDYKIKNKLFNGPYDEECATVCDKETYETIQNIKHRIEGDNNEQLNESFSEKFYALLDRMDRSKYNWV